MIEFTTDLFNSTELRPNFINDRCFGEDLIGWLVGKFDDPIFELDAPFQEDWGWATLARKNNETFLICLGIMDETIGQTPARWLLMIDKMRRFWFFGSKKSRNIETLGDKIEAIMRTEPGITAIERYNDDKTGPVL